MSIGLSLYQKMPYWLQALVVQAHGFRERRRRYGSRFDELYSSLIDSEWWTASRIEEYRARRLREVLRIARAHVPLYRDDMWHAMEPSGSDVELLDGLPIMDKMTLMAASDRVFHESLRRSAYTTRHTSGTTGSPIEVRRSNRAEVMHWATAWRHRARLGVEPVAFHANFTGQPVVALDREEPPYWHVCRPLNQITFGMQHVTRSKISSIVRALDEHDIEIVIGYPSIITRVAVLAASEGLALQRRIRGIFTSAEPLMEWQREAIEEFFDAPVSERYGQVELCGVAAQCEHGLYHEDPEIGVIEALPTGETAGALAVGDVVCTSLANEAMPLIRYRTGDRVLYDPEQPPCPCGRATRTFHRFLGRSEDFVETPEGAKLRRFDYLFKGVQNLLAAQVVQSERGRLDLRLWKQDPSAGLDAGILRTRVRQWISPTIAVDVTIMSDPSEITSGKFRPVVSMLDRDDIEETS